MTTDAAPEVEEVDPGTVKRAVAASAMGNAVEWYDYAIFTSGAIVGVIGTQFFPGEGNALLKSFGLLAISFVVRPLGGFVLGPLGDKLGRQKVLAFTVLLMSGGTFLVGCLPTYSGSYSAGIGATILILLLRLVQGFSTGGEYGGAATFMAEYAPCRKRGFWGSFLEFGTTTGYVVGNIVVLGVAMAMPPEQIAAWGWRIPFLIALPLGLVGLYLRLKLEDTPTFEALMKKGGVAEKAPFRETIRDHWRMIVNLIGIVLLLNVGDYVLLVTMPSYFTTQLHVSETESAVIIIVVELIQMALIAPLGALSDRIGRKPLLLVAAVGFIVLSYPSFKLMQSGGVVGLFVGFLIVALLLLCILAVIGSTFPAMFPTRVRYGSFAIGYNISTALFGGTAGFIINLLIDKTGSIDIPAYYLMGAGVIGLIPILLIPETSRVPMEDIQPQPGWRNASDAIPIGG